MEKVLKLGAITFGLPIEDGEESENPERILYILSIKGPANLSDKLWFEEQYRKIKPDFRCKTELRHFHFFHNCPQQVLCSNPSWRN